MAEANDTETATEVVQYLKTPLDRAVAGQYTISVTNSQGASATIGFSVG